MRKHWTVDLDVSFEAGPNLNDAMEHAHFIAGYLTGSMQRNFPTWQVEVTLGENYRQEGADGQSS